MRVLVASNLDSSRPYGQFVRPYFLSRGLAKAGIHIGSVAPDCSRVDFGRSWSKATGSMRDWIRLTRKAITAFQPDVIYAHQSGPALASLVAGRGIPVVADFHALGSAEWLGRARFASDGYARARMRAASAKAKLGETAIIHQAHAIIAAGDEVAHAIEAIWFPTQPITVVANGVDPDLLTLQRSNRDPYTERGFHAVTTLPRGSSNDRAASFLTDVAAALDRAGHELHIHVLGRVSGASARRLVYEGYQGDLRPWLDYADAALMPYPRDAMLFGGVRQKLVEYLARCRTVVSTAEGLRGLRTAAGWPGVFATGDEPDVFARALSRAVLPSSSSVDSTLVSALSWDVLAGVVLRVLDQVLRAGKKTPSIGDSPVQLDAVSHQLRSIA